MELFLDSGLSFVKQAAEINLPEDPNAWPTEILQELYKQVPCVSDFDPQIHMQQVDAEQAYGLGFVEVLSKSEIAPGSGTEEQLEASGVQQVRIPIIIREGKLQPFDIMITQGGKVMPLTEKRMREAIFRPQLFDSTAKSPGDQSMVNQLMPPNRQGGLGMGGTSSDAGMKVGSILESILPTINESDYLACVDTVNQFKVAFATNPAARQAINTLASYTPRPVGEKLAGLEANLTPTVAQVSRGESGYTVKTATSGYWKPRTKTASRGDLVETFGDKFVLDVDLSGSMTVGFGCEKVANHEGEHPTLIKDYGIYKVQDEKGRHLVGYCFPSLYDCDGTVLPIMLFTNGSHAAVQGEIVGVHVTTGAALPSGPTKGKGVFYKVLDSGKAEATIPFIMGGGKSEGRMRAETFDGKRIWLSQQGGVRKPTMVDGTCIIPADWKWLPLEKAEALSLAAAPEQFHQAAQEKAASSTVVIRGSQANFAIDGLPVEKVASSQRHMVSFDDALFLLTGLGIDPVDGIQKLSEASQGDHPVEVKVSREIVTAEGVREESVKRASARLENLPVLRRSLVKEAAALQDPMAVDTVLSLGFVNPENVTTFISYLPKMEETLSHMCELLLAARIGLKDIEVGALEKSIKSTDEVVQGLKVLAFQHH